MRVYFRLAWRELINQKRVSLFLMFNFVLGLTGLLTVSLFKGSIEAAIKERSQDYLGADLVVSARRQFEPGEIEALKTAVPQGTEIRGMRELYTTVGTSTDGRLIQLRALDEGFPFYGKIEKEQGTQFRDDLKEDLFESGGLWIYPELRVQLGVGAGDELRVGARTFRIEGVVSSDVVSAAAGLSLAPTVYLSLSSLDLADLIKEGSLVWYSYLLQLPPESASLEVVKSDLERAIPSPDIRVSTHVEASERSNQALLYLSDYLSLVALVALFLSILGASYILRNYLQKRASTFGLFKALGVKGRGIQWIFFTQMSILGLSAGVLALVLSFGAVFLLMAALNEVLSLGFTLKVNFGQLVALLFLSFLVTFLVSWPYSDRLRNLNVSHLFRESWEMTMDWSWRSVLLWTPAILSLVFMTVYLSNSYVASAVFLGSLVLSLVFLFGTGWLVFFVLSKGWRGSWPWEQALRFLNRERYSTLAAFVSLSLGFALVAMTFQLERGLVEEVALPDVAERPGLFLFDLQDEQLEPFLGFLAQRDLVPLNTSPMIRGRLLSVNEVPFEREFSDTSFSTREEERERQMRNRGFNLTYQEEMQKSQILVEGQWRESWSDDVPSVSVEQRFARRLGFKLGDVLKFDIQGVPVQGRVTSFRRVNWASFEPNFFVTFQPGVLEGAPKTFIVTLPEMDLSSKGQLQAEMVREFPNISVVDVTRVLDRMMEIGLSMSRSFRLMAILTLLAGLGVFLSIFQYRFYQRSKDVLLFKTLGASRGKLRRMVFFEAAWIAGGASSFGALLGMALSYLPSCELFDGAWASPPWQWILVPGLAVGFGYVFARFWVERLFSRRVFSGDS